MNNPITDHNNAIIDNINKSFVQNEYQEVYSAESIKNYIKDLQKSFNNNDITLDEFEKGKKDLSRLAMRRMVDKNGHQRLVYVKVHEDESGNTREIDHNEGDTVKFTKDGKEYSGTIKKLKFHDKTDKVGTAIVTVTGHNSPFSVSLAKLEKTGEDISKTFERIDKEKQSSSDEVNAMENAKKAGAKASREGNDAEARKQADIYRDLQSKKTNNGAEKTSNSEIKTGDYVKMSDKGPFTVSASQHKGKTFKVVGEVDSGLISQPKFLKLKDVESGEEVEVNPRDFVKVHKETAVKEVKSNKKDSYPDNQGGKNNSIADGMQDMSDKAKANGDIRRAELYQKYADEHRAEAKAWFEKNGGESDEKGKSKKIFNSPEKKAKIVTESGASKVSNSKKKEKFKNYDQDEIFSLIVGNNHIDKVDVADKINEYFGSEAKKYYENLFKSKLDVLKLKGDYDGGDVRDARLTSLSNISSFLNDKKILKKSISDNDIQKAFDKLGSF